jgi:hypothetical protein
MSEIPFAKSGAALCATRAGKHMRDSKSKHSGRRITHCKMACRGNMPTWRKQLCEAGAAEVVLNLPSSMVISVAVEKWKCKRHHKKAQMVLENAQPRGTHFLAQPCAEERSQILAVEFAPLPTPTARALHAVPSKLETPKTVFPKTGPSDYINTLLRPDTLAFK